jgi:hypothetical protein
VLLLKKAIYGLVHAARQWWKNFKEAMAGCTDPCLFIKKANGDNHCLLSKSMDALLEHQKQSKKSLML